METPREGGKRGEIEGKPERERERGLFEAAITGDSKALHELLQVEEGILNRVMAECTGNNNPLHLAALYGQVDFARDILSRKPELARGLNSQGQSPLHLASERGHVGVAREIRIADTAACFVRDRDGMIPLHVAAIKGRIEVLKELVNANITTAFMLTERGEPILHLCANNNQFEALRELVRLVKDVNFAKLKDSNDNTILHLLSAKKKPKDIYFLITESTRVDVNPKNADSATPLEVALEYGSWKSGWILADAGAERERLSPLKLLKVKRHYDHGSWFYEALLVVAVLMITVAFQAGINPPGGVWQDTGFHNKTLPPREDLLQDTGILHAVNTSLNGTDKLNGTDERGQHYAGRSIMYSLHTDHYKCFSVLNLITFLSSLSVIVLLFSRRVFSFWLFEASATILTFLSIMSLSGSAAVSFSFVSEKYLTGRYDFGPDWYIFLVIFLVIFSLPTPLLVTSSPILNLVWFRASLFLKRLVFGGRPAASIESGFDGRP